MKRVAGNLVKDNLYKRAFFRPLLKCLSSEEAEYVMREIHEGIGGKMLAQKILLAGYYYWPTLQKDAAQFSATCESCQKHQHIPRRPTEYLKIYTFSCPFD